LFIDQDFQLERGGRIEMNIKLLFSFMVLLIGGLMLAGCGDEAAVEEETEVVEEVEDRVLAPDEVVLLFVEATMNLDLDQTEHYISSGYLDEYEEEFAELKDVLTEGGHEAEMARKLFYLIYNNIDVEVTDYKIDGNQALVNVINTHPDPEQLTELLMSKMFEFAFNEEADLENISEEEGMELVLEMIVDVMGEVEKVTSEVEVPLTKEDDQWKIDGEVLTDYRENLEL